MKLKKNNFKVSYLKTICMYVIQIKRLKEMFSMNLKNCLILNDLCTYTIIQIFNTAVFTGSTGKKFLNEIVF